MACNVLNTNRILYSPDSLEINALGNDLNPKDYNWNSSIEAKKFGEVLKSMTRNNLNIIYVNCLKQESVKLFSNSYLAMRNCIFNEVELIALSNNTKQKNKI